MAAAKAANEPRKLWTRSTGAPHLGDGARDTDGFLAAGAFIDQDIRAGPRHMAHELLLEIIADALGGVFADPQAHGHERTPGDLDGFRGRGRDPRRGVLNAESFERPARGERRQRFAASGAVSAAFEKIVDLLGANRQQSELGEPRIGIDHDAVAAPRSARVTSCHGARRSCRLPARRYVTGACAMRDRPRKARRISCCQRARCARWGNVAWRHPAARW